MKKNFVLKLVLFISLGILIVAFAASAISKSASPKVAKKVVVTSPKAIKKVVVAHPKVEILMKDGKSMILELYPEFAPATVKNFLKLVNAGFYNGLKFHRIMKGFMIQGGDPKGDGTGGSDKTIFGEFSANGFTKNTLKHTRGVISMARGEDLNSASSQFFIVHEDSLFLDGNYAAFGKLIQGDKTLDAIANTPVKVDPNDPNSAFPVKDVIMKKVFVVK